MSKMITSATDFVASYVKTLEVGQEIQIQAVVNASNGRYGYQAVRAGLRKIRENGGPVGGAGTMSAPFRKVEVGGRDA